MEQIEFCRGGGCTAKLGPDILDRVLSRLPKQKKDPDLLVGFDTNDDAAVYRVSDDTAIVQTLDFFPPMIEDPYLFGQVAAANAMSDIWAMGGRPVTALNIVCFPQGWDLNILGRIMQGGAEKVAEAGASLCGGHSINDADVKYGLSVTGLINPKKVLTNVGAQPGDRLLLTKPLGTGIVCTAGRVKAADERSMAQAVASMTTLNMGAAEVLKRYEVHACTDVTGFSLLGHLSEMLGMTRHPAGEKGEADPQQNVSGNGPRPASGSGSRLGAVVHLSAVPYFHNVPKYVEEDFFITANGQRNRNHLGDRVVFDHAHFWQEELLFDPQTSGGLLAAVPNDIADEVLADIRSIGLRGSLIGEVTGRSDRILVRQ